MLVEREQVGGGILRIIFNRPEKLNAFNLEMYTLLAEHLDYAEDADDVKVVILSGRGRSFCSGQDLSEVGFMYGFGEDGQDRPSVRRRLAIDRRWARNLMRLQDCSKVTISQVQGHCIGAGFLFMLMSDLVVATRDATMGHPGLRLVGPGLDYNMALWMSVLGPRLAKEMLFTGRTITGERAESVRLVNAAVDESELEAETMRLARDVALLPADGIVMGKETARITSELMGVRSGFTIGPVSHTLNTHVKFDPDEFNFFRERRKKGAREAFHERDERYASSDDDRAAQSQPQR